MSQSKRRSLLEAWTNTIIGYIISNIIWMVLAWYEDLPFTFTDNIRIVTIFTVASIIRGYIVRRYFNKGDRDGSKNESCSREGA